MKFLFICLLLFQSISTYAQRDITPTSEFTISGAVEKQLTFKLSEVKQYKEHSIGEVVVRNHKGEEKYRAQNVKGILLTDLLKMADIKAEKPKDYAQLCIVLVASDGYKNVYSYGELFNNHVGEGVYVITEKDGKSGTDIPERILVYSTTDHNGGLRHLKGLTKIEVKKID